MRQYTSPGKPSMAGEGVGFFLMNEPDIWRSSQAIGDGMAKTRKATQTKGKPKREEKGKPPAAVFPTLRPPSGKPHDSTTGLNDSPGKSHLVLLPVEPFTVHVYWLLNPEEQKIACRDLGQGFVKAKSTLRFYDITNVAFDGTNARGLFDIPVDLQNKNCYVSLWSPQKKYFVELGWKTDDGQFYPLARSNAACTPSTEPGDAIPHLPKGTVGSVGKAEGPAKNAKTAFLDSASKEGVTPLVSNQSHAVDLTTRSEQAFESGISSRIVASSPKKENI